MSINNFKFFQEDLRKDKQMILFAGAGINISDGVNVSWNDVLNHLFNKAMSRISVANDLSNEEINGIMQAICEKPDSNFNAQDKYELKKISATEFPLPIIISIVKKYLGDSYLKELQMFLYNNCNRYILYDAFVECYGLQNRSSEKQYKFHTLYQLARIILLSNNIRAIVTYNFDNFLKIAIEILYNHKEKFFTNTEISIINRYHKDLKIYDIYDDIYGEIVHGNGLYIYHPHGYIPSPSESDNVSNCKIVFSLEEFYEVSRNVYAWQTDTQIHFLSHYTCIFAGISVSDITTQRMLLYAQNNGNKKHNIYYLTAYKSQKNENIKSTCKALMRLKYSFLESYGLTLLSKENFVDLYEELGKCFLEKAELY